MKKSLSVFLAVLMTFFCFVPAFAAEGSTYTITFGQPTASFEGAYIFAKTKDGVMQCAEDPNGEYVFFNNRYMRLSNVVESSLENVPPERYSPVEYTGAVTAAEGDTITFVVETSPEYNVATAAVFVNGEKINLNAKGEYSVYVDRDMNIEVAEYDENGAVSLLKNHYNVYFPESEDGFRVMTLKGENYDVIYHGGSMYFRVKINKGYSAAGMKVSVYRYKYEFPSGAGGDFAMVAGIFNLTDTLASLGVDEDGCRMYRIDNVTSDCRIAVSGVQAEKSVGIFALLKRILKLILDFLGIESDMFGSITNYYHVDISNTAPGVTYEVMRASGSEDEPAPTSFDVQSGDSVSIVVSKKNPEQNVGVIWNPGNESGSYQTVWQVKYDPLTAETTYEAVYNVDNITADTVISIF